MAPARRVAAGRAEGSSTAHRQRDAETASNNDGDDYDQADQLESQRGSAAMSQTPAVASYGNSNGIGTANGDDHAYRNGDRDSPHPTPTLNHETEDGPDTIKILVATDNHIGYNERDPVRGRDSIETFKEILQLAEKNEVDMLLLAGDLFHENKPSRASMHQTAALLREYCMGSRPISLQIVSDVGVGLQTGYSFPPINYEDENYNVGLPVFSIHGNHDDPQGAGPEGALCALDVLSACGLVNYFGRQDLPGGAATDEEARESGIQVKPVLLQKGSTKLAMYGIGNIRDERFHAEMRKNRISMFRPAENADDWFNLLLIHQNRVPHGPKSSVPENGFGDEVDLIIWGHEHDCRIVPEPVTGKAYYISQPGSSVATSLSAGETTEKCVGLLSIKGREFKMDKIPLKTVRPFLMEDIRLADVEEIEGIALDNKVKVNKYLRDRVNELIERAKENWDAVHADEEEPPPKMLPLIRIRVEYADHEVGNPQRFGQDFASKVANPKDIVQFYKKKTINRSGKKVTIDDPDDIAQAVFNGDMPERIEKIKVETLVKQYLEAQTLQMLHENGIGWAVNSYVEKDDKHAIEAFIAKTLEDQRKQIEGGDLNDQADSDEEIERNMAQAKTILARRFEERTSKKGKNKEHQQDSEEDEEEDQNQGGSDFDRMSVDDSERGSAAPVKGKKSAAQTKGRGKKQLFSAVSDNDEDDDVDQVEVPSRGKKSAKSAATKRTTTTTRKAPAKTKAGAATQSQLSFAPSRSSTGRAAAKASSSRTKTAVQAEPEDGEDDEVIDLDDSDHEPTKKKPIGRKR